MQRNKERSGVVAGILLPMGLICLFAFCSLALALMGGQAYRQIQAGVNDAYGSSVAASYLRTKLGQNNSAGAISLRDEDGLQVLVITAGSGADAYETRIFMHGSRLLEATVDVNAPFHTADGTLIAELNSCVFHLTEDGLFTAELESATGTVTRTALAIAEGGTV